MVAGKITDAAILKKIEHQPKRTAGFKQLVRAHVAGYGWGASLAMDRRGRSVQRLGDEVRSIFLVWEGC